MKALLLFPMADGQTGPAIKHAFEKLGHEVTAVDAKLHPHDSYKVACRVEPDLVFCSRTEELIPVVAQIKQKFPNAVACMWNVDTRTTTEVWEYLFPLIKSCDYHFVIDTGTIFRWRKINPNTFWLPQGLQDEVYDKPKEITDEDEIKYSCDVSFAGSIVGMHTNRNLFLDAIKKMGVSCKFWGCDGISRVYDEEHNKMVSLSKINIAMSGCPENGKSTSVRNYKIMGAGGFVLELDREGINEIFPENVMKCYTDPDDLVEKIRYWLDHDWDRWQIADMAYRWVRENATYTHRIRDALEYMGMA